METYYLNKSTKELRGEVFKPYPLNNQYLASNFGRIKSKQQIVKHNYGGVAIKKERVLTQTDNGSGYLSVGLTENGKTKTTRVSRIIAITFVENTENKPQVNHINGNKKDNRSINLEWNTSGENVRHAWNNVLAKKQSSYIYIKERLEKINPYTTNRVRCKTPIGFGTIIIDQNCYRVEYDNGKFENLVKALRFWQDDFKLCLRNLSDLTKEIEHKGEKFAPIVELLKIEQSTGLKYATLNYKVISIDIHESIDGNTYQLEYEEPYSNMENGLIQFSYSDRFRRFGKVMFKPYKQPLGVGYQIDMFQKLIEWKFDIAGLIDKNEAIDVNTLEVNPYK